jgi:hypothetical protein
VAVQSVTIDDVELLESTPTTLRCRAKGLEFQIGWRDLVPYPGHGPIQPGGHGTLQLKLDVARRLGLVD